MVVIIVWVEKKDRKKVDFVIIEHRCMDDTDERDRKRNETEFKYKITMERVFVNLSIILILMK